MTTETETLLAFVDGELPPEEMTRVEALLRARPDLDAFVEQQRRLRRELHDSFDTIANGPIPDALLRKVMETQPSWQWRLSRGISSLFSARGLMWTGIPAATLACGVAIGMFVSNGNALMDMRGGALLAHGSLAHALNQQLASAEPAQGPHIGITFRDRNQRYCRTFTASGLAGVACRSDTGWNIAALSQAPTEQSGAYGTAASAMPNAVRHAVEDMIQGAPLGADAERQARDHGWKNQ